MDIFQTQTSAQLILARASSLVRKGSKVTKVLLSYTVACNDSSTFGENKILY